MFNYYLCNVSYENSSLVEFERNLLTLNRIFTSRKPHENFIKHDSIWLVKLNDGSFCDVAFSKLSDTQFSTIVFPKLMNHIHSIGAPIGSINEFNSRYELYNAFFGISFPSCEVGYAIFDDDSYAKFYNDNIWQISHSSFWERREILFSRIIFCQNVRDQIISIGGTYFNQIIDILKELEEYALKHWNSGGFSYLDVRNRTSLNISPESNSTTQNPRLHQLRVFALPDGRKEYFDLHIKTGNLRFHIFPCDNIIYVGYIGYHLETSRG